MMNLKYYLRGLGIGILVTALIMSIAAGGKETLSNEEIKERAKTLGMVEEGTLLQDAQAALNTSDGSEMNGEGKQENEQNPAESEAPEQTSEPDEAQQSESMTSDESQQSEKVTSEETPEQSESEVSGDTPQQSETPQPEDDGESGKIQESEVIVETEGVWPSDEDRAEGENITVQVRRGDSSYTVCKRLEEAGVIVSASEFDTFLCQNGYDKKIRAGTFEIPASAGQEEIARILVGVQ